VFVALLGPRIPKSELLAALLLYRAVYYLLPLTMAGLLYLVMELRARDAGGSAGAPALSVREGHAAPAPAARAAADR
jgi:hypothetical protein